MPAGEEVFFINSSSETSLLSWGKKTAPGPYPKNQINKPTNTKIAIKIANWTHKTTVRDYSNVITDPRKADSVAQALQSLDDGLDDTINLAGVSGHWNGIDTTIDLV